jgi:hypothetical protein
MFHGRTALVGAVSAGHVDRTIIAVTRDTDVPRIAADFAVLDQCAGDVGLQIDLELFSTIWTGDEV